MHSDIRLAGGGLGDLARLLSRALDDQEEIRGHAVAAGIYGGAITSGGRLETQWRSVLLAASEQDKLDILLRELRSSLASRPRVAEEFDAWLGRAARTENARQAVNDVKRLGKTIRQLADPREGLHALRALRDALLDLLDFLSDDTAAISLFPTAGRQVDAEDRRELLRRVRAARSAVEHLQSNIAAAASLPIRRSMSEAELFTRHDLVAGKLLDQRDDVDEACVLLLEAIARLIV